MKRLTLLVLFFAASSAIAAEPFVATSVQSAAELMHQAMEIMDRDMRAAPMSGDVDRDFAAMMIPHHQGAIDMAKVLLLYGKDVELRHLAQQIVTDQQTEIDLMRAWQRRHPLKETEPKHFDR